MGKFQKERFFKKMVLETTLNEMTLLLSYKLKEEFEPILLSLSQLSENFGNGTFVSIKELEENFTPEEDIRELVDFYFKNYLPLNEFLKNKFIENSEAKKYVIHTIKKILRKVGKKLLFDTLDYISDRTGINMDEVKVTYIQ